MSSMEREDNINNNGKWANKKKKKDRDEFPMLPYFLPDYLYLYKSVYIGCEGEGELSVHAGSIPTLRPFPAE